MPEADFLPSPSELAERAKAVREESLKATRDPAPPPKPLRTLPPREAVELSRKYHGISWTGWKWRATLTDPVTRNQIVLGAFDDPTEAARAYDKALADFALHDGQPNFPDEMPDHWKAKARPPKKPTLPPPFDRKPVAPKSAASEAEKPAHNFRGITRKKNGWWVAQVKHPGSGTKTTWIARCRTAEEAARKYDAYVVKHDLGKPLNFPAEHPGYTPRPGEYRTRPHEGKAKEFAARLVETEKRAAPVVAEAVPKPGEMPVRITPIDDKGEPVTVESPPFVTLIEGPKITFSPPVAVPTFNGEAFPPKPDPWEPIQTKLDAVADLLAALRRHPRDVGLEALKYLLESAS